MIAADKQARAARAPAMTANNECPACGVRLFDRPQGAEPAWIAVFYQHGIVGEEPFRSLADAQQFLYEARGLGWLVGVAVRCPDGTEVPPTVKDADP